MSKNSQTRDVSRTFIIIGSIAIAIVIVAILFSSFFDQQRQQNKTESSSEARPELTEVKAPLGTIHAEIASTPSQMEKGLGDRDSLGPDKGMLFTFNAPGDYGFWMKDMRFPIDIVWILSNKKVAGVTSNIASSTYPKAFYPPLAISYVLELNAGDAARLGIATGTQLVF